MPVSRLDGSTARHSCGIQPGAPRRTWQAWRKVTAFWDQEAFVWVAESKRVPGLVTEADTVEPAGCQAPGDGAGPAEGARILAANATDVPIRLTAERAIHAPHHAARMAKA
jgi:hypothetical protein